MITPEERSQINSIWQAFYDGGMSVASTIIDQLCVLMYIKMLDDKQKKVESQARIIRINPDESKLTFKSGEWENPETGIKIPYEKLRWSNFTSLSSDKMAGIIKEHVYPFIKNLHKSSKDVFSAFLSDVTFGFDGKHEVLQKVVDNMASIDFTNNDMMGDFFENMIDGKLNGQFRTPRHIIDMMVAMVNPQLGYKIIDPAMGTAGFLVGAAKYIKEHNKEALLNKENRKFFTEEQFAGTDTEPIMTRIACMNLLFHEVENPDLSTKSYLIADNNEKHMGQYDVVLANPPFKGSLDFDSTDPRILSVTKAKKTELLFVALFTKLLKVGGTCASIIPDGVLFGTSNAHIALRKELLDRQHLRAVVSLPAGVFQPYSGVKTSFVLFDKTGNSGTDKVWFYGMEGDGYTLDAKRNPDPQHNDCNDVVQRFTHLEDETNRSRYEKSFFVSADEIRTNEYDLTFNRYKQSVKEKKTYRSTQEINDDLLANEKTIITSLNSIRKMLDLPEIKKEDLICSEKD